jgi:RNA polymerase sigma-70 factor (ECF subfamily)
VLSLRLLDGATAEELREALGVTDSNLWVMLHRARLRLWECLDGKGLVPGREASGT